MQKGDFRAGVFNVMSFSYGGVRTDWFVPSYGKTDRLLIDQTRMLLGLEPLGEYYQKLLFIIENPKTPYVFDIRRTIVEVADEAAALGHVGRLVKLKNVANQR